MAKPRQIDLAYLAGFMDGEGAVMLSLHPSGRVKLGVAVSQNTRNVPDMYERFFGGGVYQYQPKKHKSYIYQWRANGVVAMDFLNQVEPFLLVKRYAAQEARKAWTASAEGQLDLARQIVEAYRQYVTERKAAL